MPNRSLRAWRLALAVVAPAALAAACAPRASEFPPKVAAKKAEVSPSLEPPWRSPGPKPTAPPRHQPVVIENARLLLGDGKEISSGHLTLVDGKIGALGSGKAPSVSGARHIDAKGKVVTPGLIDTHSHIGVYPVPRLNAHMDGNEATAPVTAEVRAVDAVWPQDPAITRAVAGGVTTIQVLPGSANLIGGAAVTLKLRRATSSKGMRFQGAPVGLKMACGENPKRVYGGRKSAPSTRMGNLAGQRAAFHSARRLMDEWEQFRKEDEKRRREDQEARAKWDAKKEQEKARRAWCERVRSAGNRKKCAAWQQEWAGEEAKEPEASLPKLPPARDLALETLAGALEGRVLVHVHCYRADDMSRVLALADEVGLQIRSFHHALEAYKIRGELVRRKISVSTWADWWGFKIEAYDGIPENIALIEAAGGMPIVHSDSVEGIQRLNQEAAKALWVGRHAGLGIDPARAISWVTRNPAWALGIDDRVGTLAVGKDADVVIWNGDPLSVYSSAQEVFIDGARRYVRGDDADGDFEVRP